MPLFNQDPALPAEFVSRWLPSLTPHWTATASTQEYQRGIWDSVDEYIDIGFPVKHWLAPGRLCVSVITGDVCTRRLTVQVA